MAGITSIENGKKGGRPIGSKDPHTLMREKAREVLIKKVEENIEVIVSALIEKAKQGDISAVKELLDRAWGRVPQALVGDRAEPLHIVITKYAKEV